MRSSILSPMFSATQCAACRLRNGRCRATCRSSRSSVRASTLTVRALLLGLITGAGRDCCEHVFLVKRACPYLHQTNKAISTPVFEFRASAARLA